jgi:predicted aconitase
MGPAVAMAMSILSRMAPIYGAERLLDITAAHIDSSVYMGPATLQFAERLVELGAKVVVPSTLNVSGVDEMGWREYPVPEEWAEGSRLQMRAYEAMGCIPTWTCAPYQTHHRPTFGQQIASGESNAIAFFNSVIGARTERYPDMLDICAAITGRAPAAGLHLDENRLAQVELRLEGIPDAWMQNDAFYPALGNLLGTRAPDTVTVVTGLTVNPSEDQLKAIGAAAASSGAVALFHIEGVTPEAPTLAEATGGKTPTRVEIIDRAAIRAGRDALETTRDDGIEMVLLGSPHFSFDEFRRMAALVKGRRRHPDVQLIVTCSRAVRAVIERTGHLDPVLEFGARLTVDTCPLVSPMLPKHVRRIMTNSAKYAYYAPGLLGTSVRFGGLEDCIASAEAGHVKRVDDLWA